MKSSIGISSSAGQFNINIKTDKQNLTATIALLNDLLTLPTFPEKELEVLKRGAIAGLESNRNEPGSVALESFRKALYNYPTGHPKAYASTDEKIQKISAVNSQVLSTLYHNHFTLQHGYISVIGDVEPNNINNNLQQTFAKFTVATPYQKLITQLKEQQGLIISSNTPDKANAQLYIINPLMMNTNHPDYLALSIAMKIFGGDPFTSRLGARIRVKEGYSYSVGAGLQIPSDQEQGLFYASAIAAPENMENVITALKEETQLVVEQGFTEEELNNAVQGYIKSRSRSWAENNVIASVLIDISKYQRDLSFYDQQVNAVKALTLNDVQQAFKKHIASQKLNVFKAGDFEKVNK